MNLDEFVVKYAVFLSNRSSLKQRKLFLSAVHQDFGDLGYEVKGITERRKGKRSLNIQLGDVLNAKTLIIAPYDMPARRFFSKGYHPFREEDNVLVKLFSENIITLGLIILALLMYWLTSNINTLLSYVIMGLFTALILATAILFPLGLTCRYTANKNNSALAVMLRMAETLKAQKDFAFVLLDHVYLNHHGELMLSNLLKKKGANPLIVYLDCVGYGDAAIVSSSIENQTLAKHLVSNADETLRFETKTYDHNEILSSALNRFPKAVNVSVGNLIGSHWSVPKVRTPKDTEIDENTIAAVSKVLLKGLQNK